MENENVWEFAVKSVEEVGQCGLCRRYVILFNGKDRYTGKTKDDYIKEGYTLISRDEFEDFLIAQNERNLPTLRKIYQECAKNIRAFPIDFIDDGDGE